MFCSKLSILNNTRRLWSEHASWTGAAITSIVLKAPNEEAVTNRLLRNPKDFAELLTPFYGSTVAAKFDELLTEHLVLAAKLIKATMAKRKKEAENLKKEWFRNGNEIVDFLSSINPHWHKETWRKMFFHHLDLVYKEALALIKKDYTGAVTLQDKLEIEALEMADMMAKGLIAHALDHTYHFV